MHCTKEFEEQARASLSVVCRVVSYELIAVLAEKRMKYGMTGREIFVSYVFIHTNTPAESYIWFGVVDCRVLTIQHVYIIKSFGYIRLY